VVFSALKRHEKMMELLLRNGEIKVAEVAEVLGVTNKTVREDLIKLEQQGLLVRIHGGAVLPSGGHVGSFPDKVSQTTRLAEKRVIAAKAVALIEPEDIVALDGGSTALEIARQLPNEPLTVITNDVYIIGEIIAKDQIRLVVPGGYRKRNLLVNGDSAAFLRKLNISKAFISASGLHVDFGLTIYTTELAEQKRAIMDNAKISYCIADHTKFDKYALMTFAKLTDVALTLTDDGLHDETRARYEAAGMTIR